MVISASNGNCEAFLRTAERFDVQTHYYRLPMWPVTSVTKKVTVQQTLGDSVLILKNNKLSIIWRDYWHDGRADYSNKITNNAKNSSYKGLKHNTYDVSLQSFAIAAILNFVTTSNFISIPSPPVYKLSMIRFCTQGIFWCRFLDNT